MVYYLEYIVIMIFVTCDLFNVPVCFLVFLHCAHCWAPSQEEVERLRAEQAEASDVGQHTRGHIDGAMQGSYLTLSMHSYTILQLYQTMIHHCLEIV